jgi:hypothetical protein
MGQEAPAEAPDGGRGDRGKGGSSQEGLEAGPGIGQDQGRPLRVPGGMVATDQENATRPPAPPVAGRVPVPCPNGRCGFPTRGG